MLSADMDEPQTIGFEGRLIGRYLTGADLPDELVARYVEASRTLFPDGPSTADATVLEFVRRHPWSLPPLESALGLLRPSALLRRKIVVMMAILETEPRFADRFDPVCPGPIGVLWRLCGLGLSSATKLGAGSLLCLYLRARK